MLEAIEKHHHRFPPIPNMTLDDASAKTDDSVFPEWRFVFWLGSPSMVGFACFLLAKIKKNRKGTPNQKDGLGKKEEIPPNRSDFND